MIWKKAAATSAYHGAPPAASTTTAMIVSDVNDGNDAPLIEPKKPAKSAPKIPAKNAEIANTRTRVTFVVAPLRVERERRVGERAEQPSEATADDRDDDDRAHHRDREDE